MGRPNRFIHWYWGGTYKELVTQQHNEVRSILALALNTRNVEANEDRDSCRSTRETLRG